MTYCESCGHYKVCKDKAEYWSNCPNYIEPVWHGKWVDTQPNYKDSCYRNAHVCSNCHNYYTKDYEYMNYCPQCGAKMDGD